jgi:DNA-binding beta-propeller fold protein YncE
MSARFVLGQPDFATGGANSAAPFGNINSANPAEGCTTEINACGATRIFSVAYDSNRQLLFATDADNNRVLVWDLSAGIRGGMPASYVVGQRDFVSGGANAGCTEQDTDGLAGPCGLKLPSDVHYDSMQDTLYVADTGNHRVVAYDVSTALVDGFQAHVALGQDDLSQRVQDNGCEDSVGMADACSLHRPHSIALDSSGGRLFVSDFGGHRVMVYDVSTGLVSGMAADAVLGQPDFTTTTVNTPCPGAPSGIGACGFGEWDLHLEHNAADDLLFVSDSENNRVLIFDTNAIDNGEAAVGVLGRPDFVSKSDMDSSAVGGGTDQQRMIAPFGASYDPSTDRVYVSDGGNHRVLLFGPRVSPAPLELNTTSITCAGIAPNCSTDDHSVETTTNTVDNGDGTTTTTTTVRVTNRLGRSVEVTLPEGATPLPGTSDIGVDFNTGLYPHYRMDMQFLYVHADLHGATKEIAMSGSIYTRNLCIYDHADTNFVEGQICGAAGTVNVSWPAAGSCVDMDIQGDLGDNPDDPNDPEGWHPIRICTDPDGSMIRVSGLKHTALAVVDERPDLPGPHARPGSEYFHEDREDHEAGPTGGCSLTPSSSGATGLAWFGLMIVLFRRRHRRQ